MCTADTLVLMLQFKLNHLTNEYNYVIVTAALPLDSLTKYTNQKSIHKWSEIK